jgi:hypothetical protein
MQLNIYLNQSEISFKCRNIQYLTLFLSKPKQQTSEIHINISTCGAVQSFFGVHLNENNNIESFNQQEQYIPIQYQFPKNANTYILPGKTAYHIT